MIRHVFLDVDNTILDFDANEAESFRNMTIDLEVPYTGDPPLQPAQSGPVEAFGAG